MSLNIRKSAIINRTKEYIKKEFESEGSGHDWWHVYRVRNLAIKIANLEGGDLFLIEMAALLHDLDDWKICSEDELRVEKWLLELDLEKSVQTKIIEITRQVSFKGANVENKAISPEAKIVQDADRLDAIGAIGIARTFSYGGSKGRLIYDPGIKPEMHNSFDAYKKTTSPTINHFYEKLLLLKDRLNTKTAKKIAVSRHQYLTEYLNQFFKEWEGIDF